MAREVDSLVKSRRRRPGGVPAIASRSCDWGTWSRTARRSLPSRSPRSSKSTRSDKDGLLTVRVGKGESSVIMEASQPLGDIHLGGLGVVEPERRKLVQ